MPIVKTGAGQQVMKDRSVALTPRQRSAFILFDGRKTVDDVLKATAAVGVTSADVEHLLALGLLADTGRAQPMAKAGDARGGALPAAGAGTGRRLRRSPESWPEAPPAGRLSFGYNHGLSLPHRF